EIETIATRFGMRSNHRMVDRRDFGPLRVRQRIFAVTPAARKIEIVHGAQVVDTCFPSGIEALIRAVHVAEMRLATLRRHHLAIDDRRLSGDALPRPVRMPMQRSPVRMAAVGLAVFIEIRESIELGKAVSV